ncbi:hypothetical protein CONPUDRAFT_94404 [Coniophora puteana RWD-64-598 SS2]|uniref:G domain-containing protein n=1 Tax=Coniophora puteana (strain RWD-64-598) TaxID=741705 RepID=A0A5M3N5D0_CONPW|nr:uncharacterized protein CONPUDRAFT_94404 [Coniophora puteana RWD-64-598 SS2]EIW86121.1 hypothetical protein CONPUDRAFT_94404 [Coniophora puteana RWD-64-598 SS2]
MAQKPMNIILFGETGAGKSSIVNMLSGKTVAKTSNTANGCTPRWSCYRISIGGKAHYVYDTVGLNEGDGGTIPNDDAIVQLYQLLTGLEDGISLIIFVMRGPRMKDASCKNWTLFHDMLCQQRVNASLIVTGLEQEDNMDDWWPENKATFHKHGVRPHGVAAITATPGKRRGGRCVFQDEFEASKAKVEGLINDYAMPEPYHIDKAELFKEVTETCCNGGNKNKAEVVRRLANLSNLSYEKAEILAIRLSDM